VEALAVFEDNTSNYTVMYIVVGSGDSYLVTPLPPPPLCMLIFLGEEVERAPTPSRGRSTGRVRRHVRVLLSPLPAHALLLRGRHGPLAARYPGTCPPASKGATASVGNGTLYTG